MNTAPPKLSRREAEVARLVAEGLTSREIAQRLFISERTAEGHVDQIRNKLGFRSRTQIAAWVAAQTRPGDLSTALSDVSPAPAQLRQPQRDLKIARRWLWAGGVAMALIATGIVAFTLLLPALLASTQGPRIETFAGTGSAILSADANPRWSTGLIAPNGLAIDQKGDLYFADGNRIRRIGSDDGLVKTVAGTGDPGFFGDGGPAIQAKLSIAADGAPELVGIAIDGLGDVFFADRDNNRVREITPDGLIHTVAGSGPSAISSGPPTGNLGDGGPATSARLSEPHGLAIDSVGNLVIADTADNRIRLVDRHGIISTIAGDGTLAWGGDGGPASAAKLAAPEGLVFGNNGDLFISEPGSERIRRISSNGVITTYAGGGSLGFSGDNVRATKASLNLPLGLAIDSRGNLYVADSGNHRVRRIDQADTISTVAGNGQEGFSGDSKAATAARLHFPVDVVIAQAGVLYVADSLNNRIRDVALGAA